MRMIQIITLLIITVFYLVYFVKMYVQRQQGIQTNQMGVGEKPAKVRRIEIALRMMTIVMVIVEIVSVLFNLSSGLPVVGWLGIVIAGVGCLFFTVAVVTMRNNWRAGIAIHDDTELVTTGIYQISRNPAFTGFYLMYIGVFVSFANPVHLVCMLATIAIFHRQVKQEEEYLSLRFGATYAEYRRRTRRYL